MKITIGQLRETIREALTEAFVYGDEGPRGRYTGKPPHMWGKDAVMRAWERHVENMHFLRFMSKAGTPMERAQANEELRTAEKKLRFWENHSEFDKAMGEEISKRIARNWASKKPGMK